MLIFGVCGWMYIGSDGVFRLPVGWMFTSMWSVAITPGDPFVMAISESSNMTVGAVTLSTRTGDSCGVLITRLAGDDRVTVAVGATCIFATVSALTLVSARLTLVEAPATETLPAKSPRTSRLPFRENVVLLPMLLPALVAVMLPAPAVSVVLAAVTSASL